MVGHAVFYWCNAFSPSLEGRLGHPPQAAANLSPVCPDDAHWLSATDTVIRMQNRKSPTNFPAQIHTGGTANDHYPPATANPVTEIRHRDQLAPDRRKWWPWPRHPNQPTQDMIAATATNELDTEVILNADETPTTAIGLNYPLSCVLSRLSLLVQNPPLSDQPMISFQSSILLSDCVKRPSLITEVDLNLQLHLGNCRRFSQPKIYQLIFQKTVNRVNSKTIIHL